MSGAFNRFTIKMHINFCVCLCVFSVEDTDIKKVYYALSVKINKIITASRNFFPSFPLLVV